MHKFHLSSISMRYCDDFQYGFLIIMDYSVSSIFSIVSTVDVFNYKIKRIYNLFTLTVPEK